MFDEVRRIFKLGVLIASTFLFICYLIGFSCITVVIIVSFFKETLSFQIASVFLAVNMFLGMYLSKKLFNQSRTLRHVHEDKQDFTVKEYWQITLFKIASLCVMYWIDDVSEIQYIFQTEVLGAVWLFLFAHFVADIFHKPDRG